MLEYFTTINMIVLISVILNLTLLIGVRNLLRQNNQLEDTLVNTINNVRDRVYTALENMRRLDKNEVFEKDDEVGASFDEIKKIIEDLDNEI